MANIKLGELLVKASVLNESQLRVALSEQRKWGGKLGDVLVRMKMITEDLLVRALAKQLNIPAVNLDSITTIPGPVRDRLPLRLAHDLCAVPLQLRDDNKTLVVAFAEPQNLSAQDKVRAVCHCRVVVSVASKSAIERAIERFYGTVRSGASAGTSQTAPIHPDEISGMSEDDSFKILDAQNQTRVKSLEELGVQPTPAKNTPSAPVPSAPSSSAAPPASPDAAALALTRFEEIQRREIATVRALVELLIEKGYFSKDEYLAKMRR